MSISSQLETDTSIRAQPAAAQVLTEIWGELLGRETVGPHENFFELGGQSPLAMTLLDRVGQRWGIRLPLIVIFRYPTIHEMARIIDTQLSRASDPSEPIEIDLTEDLP